MSGRAAATALTCDAVREMAGAFVLGALDASEDAAIRAHLASCEDGHAEIAALGGVLNVLAASVPIVEAPAGLKGRIMAAAAADLPAATMAPITFPGAEQRAVRRARGAIGSGLLRIAAVLIVGLLGTWNLLLQHDLATARSYQDRVAAVLQVAAEPGSLTAILSADIGSGTGLAAVDSRGTVALAMQNLQPTSGASVYEAWVIAGDGVPVALGGFQVGSDGTGSLRATGLPTTPGIVLALTLEPGPGATKPSSPAVSKGVASAAS